MTIVLMDSSNSFIGYADIDVTGIQRYVQSEDGNTTFEWTPSCHNDCRVYRAIDTMRFTNYRARK